LTTPRGGWLLARCQGRCPLTRRWAVGDLVGNLLGSQRWCGYVRALGQPLNWRVALGINARALAVHALLTEALLGGEGCVSGG